MLLFAGSGCAALIYEIVWYQLLQLAIGSTAVSLAVLLATFMGGLALGSWLLPRLVPANGPRAGNPLAIYGGIELGIAVCGGIELFLIPAMERAYVAGAQYGMAGLLLRGLFCTAALLPPTMLMGASLPAIARWTKASPRGISWWGMLYGINTGGAVAGCILAGFYLLPKFDIVIATLVAVAVNLVISVVSFLASWRLPWEQSTDADHVPERGARAQMEFGERPSIFPIYLAVGISGACAMGTQVIWTRNMGLMLGLTVYAFTNILASFLIGLGVGAQLGALFGRGKLPRVALGWCQIFAVFGIAWTAWNISSVLPNWLIDSYYTSRPIYTFPIDFARSLWAVIPATVAWGASVPLAFASAARVNSTDAGRTAGGVYAANTVGAIFGALAVSLLLIPQLGSHASQQILMILSVIGGLVAMWSWLRRGRARVLGTTACAIFLAAWATISVASTPDNLIAWGRRMAVMSSSATVLETVEGLNSSIAFSKVHGADTVQFHVGGRVEASTAPQDMRLQRMLGYLPALLTNPRAVLVVGFGSGVTAGTFTQFPSVEHVVICEMEPQIPPRSSHYFSAQNYDVLHDPKTRMVYDDARHFILTTTEKFDLITSDPIHPYVKGSASLYSKEYFEMVRAHLNPQGIVTQWVPLYETDPETVKSEMATFFAVFPNGQVYANLDGYVGYDVVLMGRLGDEHIPIDTLEKRLQQPEYERVLRSLRDVGFNSVYDLYGTFAGSSADLREWLLGAVINRDRDLRLQYLAGLSLNQRSQNVIYHQIVDNRQWPNPEFAGSAHALQQMTSALVH